MPDPVFDTCPRCNCKTTEVQFRSPVQGAWELYRCTTCMFTWRSTEPASMTNPELYDPVFKIDPNDLSSFPVMPAIPPLKDNARREAKS
ncbi:hypothetical protein CB0101_00820 [Synechococcus sp. CB0101]|uniref:non-oxidative hydroxyarylic acid decarboxylases subunit D n=1 Tax=Synechococcus sp. CB0101 TaxID=232348 RepID=UPI0008FEE065|nr:hypothetical protein CB0101_00820 [Synechococcus sp. CB0101]